MSTLIVGDSKHATFAENTGMTAYGPLLAEFGHRDAKGELRSFWQDWLDEHPRTLWRRDELHEEFDKWKRSRDK